MCLLGEVGMKEVQHGGAILAAIECNTHLIKAGGGGREGKQI